MQTFYMKIVSLLRYRMNCCQNADFDFLVNGVKVRERNLQADGSTLQFFPYRNIKTARYNYTRGDGGTLTIWIADTKYVYSFPCNDGGSKVFEQIIGNLPT